MQLNGFQKTNPDKFKSIIIQKSNQTSKSKQFLIGNNVAEVDSSIKLLGTHLDDQLNFNLHISNICKSASKQLNALVRLKCFLGFEDRKVLTNSFLLSNFNYCPVIWSMSPAKSLNTDENLQKQALLFVHNDYRCSYEEFLKKSGKSTVNVPSYRTLFIVLCVSYFV